MTSTSHGAVYSGRGGQGQHARGGDIGSHNTHNTTINNYHQGGTVLAGLKEQLRPVFDAGIIERKACLPGTRKGTIERLSKWIEDPIGSRVFFLVGGAGTGKSAIAHAIAIQFQKRGRLGSCFCFNRSFRGSHNPQSLFRTLAYNLCEWDSDFRNALATIIEKQRSSINMTDVSSQWNHLLLAPAKHLKGDTGTILLVIDALDESGTQDSRRLLLSLLTEHADQLPQNFRVLITSRPEADVTDAIDERFPQVDMMNLNNHHQEARLDIDIYFRHRFSVAERKKGKLADLHFSQLIKQADGLFQWAFTVCEWLLGPKMKGLSWGQIFKRLESADGAGIGFQTLDALYSNILREAFNPEDKEVITRYHSVMAQIFSASEPLSINSLNDLYSLSNDALDNESRMVC